MAGYDPKRPRPAAGGDDPAPVEALIDLADHKSSDEPPAPRQPPVAAGAVASPSAPAQQRPLSSEVTSPDQVPRPAGRLVLAGVLAACTAVLVIVVLRRRRVRR